MKTTQEVADRLVQLCRGNKNLEAIEELYADHVVSKEPKGSNMPHTEGKASVKDKTAKWEASVEKIHSAKISDPIVADNHFSVAMDFDATYKEHGRMPMSEIAVYEVKDGKIVSDEFFYHMH
ncbi:MAG: nuclear transport factor 2 family protein [Candidatus Pedobacter colombiensis]|uniref:Nuclear transport factor 2 family protein n=1 Tax=Candidatus Pedobacter colombiensis TaxID=3121371 RepID=A0AAJ5W910_9SPHI|nr:nuclear transport factor 2 family protein [Pedobacter sp.]WEK20139.1 MAG: nuclear transport factor 2 family protein [Pedobacter sp.]